MTPTASPAAWLSGYIPDIPTPFDATGAIDLRAFQRLCARQIEANVSAIVVGETAGEASTLSAHEQGQLIHAARGVAHGRIQIIAGAGSNSTQQAIELTRCVAAAGADAVLSVVPYYNKPMQSGIEAHFRAIAEATRLPIILHDIPARTNRELADATLTRLAHSGPFVGLRDGTGDISRVARLRKVLPEGFRLMSGDDPSALGFMADGGDGCISLISNVAPVACRTVFDHCRREKWSAARALHSTLAPLAALLTQEGPPALKAALHQLGLIQPQVRLPLVMPEDAMTKDIARAAKIIGEPDLAIVG